MRLMRDLIATLVTACGLALALSVTQGWGWPILGDSVQWGVVSLGLVSLVACGSSGWADEETIKSWYKDPFIVAAGIVGTATLVIGVIAFFTGSVAWLVGMMVATVLVWLISTVHHVVQSVPSGRPIPTS